jgi:hypothetical protein
MSVPIPWWARPVQGVRRRRVTGLPAGKAEELLDWLEVWGWPGRLSVDEWGFTVEYDCLAAWCPRWEAGE